MLRFLSDLRALSELHAAEFPPMAPKASAPLSSHEGAAEPTAKVAGMAAAPPAAAFRKFPLRLHPLYKRSHAPRGRVVGVSLALNRPEQILAASVCEVREVNMYDKGVPRPHSLADLRMGPSDRDYECLTCAKTIQDCIGHPGHIALRVPVYHVAYLAYAPNTILHVLQCVCHSCSAFLLPESDPRFERLMRINPPARRLAEFAKVCQTLDYCKGACSTGGGAPFDPHATKGAGGTEEFDVKAYVEQTEKTGRPCGCGTMQRVYVRNKLRIHAFQRIVPERGAGAPPGPPNGKAGASPCPPVGKAAAISAMPPPPPVPMEVDAPASTGGQGGALAPPPKKQAMRKRCGAALRSFTAADALTIFRRIREEDLARLGFEPGVTRPEYAILQNLPVPPPCVRVATIGANGNKAETDVTKLLKRIVSTNTALGKKLDVAGNALMDEAQRADARRDADALAEKLQRQVAAYIDNNAPGITPIVSHTKTPMKSWVDVFVKKQGRIRSNLCAKRQNYSARTVAGSHNRADIDELGLPEQICRVITIPEVVTAHNIHRLQRLVHRGPDSYPGATSIIRASGEELDLAFSRHRRCVIKIGDTVERHLLAGDVVLLNRPPSLHKMSIMALRVRPHKGQTVRVHVCCTRPYNLDYDGDELIIHVPQTAEARAECWALMKIETQLLDPQDKACMGTVQDALIQAYAGTHKDVFVSASELAQCHSQMRYGDAWQAGDAGEVMPEPAVQFRSAALRDGGGWTRLWTGKQCAALVFPRAQSPAGPISVQYAGGDVTLANLVSDSVVVVQDSQLLCGRLGKQDTGASRGGIVQQVVHDFGQEVALQFLSDLHRVYNHWIGASGFGSGVADILNDAGPKIQEINDAARRYLAAWKHSSSAVQEEHIKEVLDAVRNECGRQALRQTTAIELPSHQIVKSGAKGNSSNPVQTGALVGQVIVQGRRPPHSYGDRCTPHFPVGSRDPEASGFVSHSFVDGLTPIEAFFHAMGGREGLVDTSSKTAPVGYLIRRLLAALMDARIHWDQTVRDGRRIVQFCYGGDDASDPAWLQTQPFPWTKWSAEKLRVAFDACRVRPRDWPLEWRATPEMRVAMEQEMDAIVQDALTVVVTKLRFTHSELDTTVKAPVHFLRLLQVAREGVAQRRALARQTGRPVAELDPMTVILAVRDLDAWCRAQVRCEAPLVIFRALLHIHLSSVNVIIQQQLDRPAFEFVLNEVRHQLQRSIVQAGEMVGAIAGQSIGEMTLNSTDWLEQIVLRHRDRPDIIICPIGEFVDDLVNKLPASAVVQHHPNETLWIGTHQSPDTRVANVDVLSVDKDGRVCWRALEGVLRHPPLREGKRDTLLRVTTKDGRTATATRGESFLTRRDNELRVTRGEELKVGDYLPVAIRWPSVHDGHTMTHLDLRRYLLPTQWIYGSEMRKAKHALDAARQEGRTQTAVWREAGTTFIVPYKSLKSLLGAFNGSRSLKKLGQGFHADGYVYPKNVSRATTVRKVPEKLALTREFGFFVGAYVAEGCANKYQVMISNLDADFRETVQSFVSSLGTHFYVVHKTACGPRGTWNGCDVRVPSMLLATLMAAMCGRNCYEKRLPPWCLLAPDDFLVGICDGYFAGDGWVSKQSGSVNAVSVSQRLLEDMQRVLMRLGMFSHVAMTMVETKRSKDAKYGMSKEDRINLVGPVERRPMWNIVVYGEAAKTFARIVGSTIKRKKQRMDDITLKTRPHYSINSMDWIPGNNTPHAQGDLHRDKLRSLLESKEVLPGSPEHTLLKAAVDSDCYFDPIVSIEEVESSHEHVYDLTVADTRNFVLASGLGLHDSFHSAGLGSRTVAGGVPQLDESTRAPPKPRNAGMTVYLDDQHQTRDKALEVMRQLQPRKLRHFVLKRGIYFDPNPTSTVFKSDRALVAAHMALVDEAEMARYKQLSPFVLRVQFSRSKCLEFGKTVHDLFWLMKGLLPGNHFWVVSPVNAKHWVVRVHLSTASSDYRKRRRVSKRGAPPSASAAAAAAALFAPPKQLKAGSRPPQQQHLLVEPNDDAEFRTDSRVLRGVLASVVALHVVGVPGITHVALLEKQRCIQPADTPLSLATALDVPAGVIGAVKGGVSERKEMVIETRGTALRTVLNIPGVDHRRTRSTNIVEIANVLGIDAATTALEHQIRQVFQQTDAYAGTRHIALLSAMMTKTGVLVGLKRNGFNQDRLLGWLKRATFERVVQELVSSAQMGEVDALTNVLSNVIIGNAPPIGTELTSVHHDEASPALLDPATRELQRHNREVLAARLMPRLDRDDLLRMLPDLDTAKNRRDRRAQGPSLALVAGAGAGGAAAFRSAANAALIRQRDATLIEPVYDFSDVTGGGSEGGANPLLQLLATAVRKRAPFAVTQRERLSALHRHRLRAEREALTCPALVFGARWRPLRYIPPRPATSAAAPDEAARRALAAAREWLAGVTARVVAQLRAEWPEPAPKWPLGQAGKPLPLPQVPTSSAPASAAPVAPAPKGNKRRRL